MRPIVQKLGDGHVADMLEKYDIGWCVDNDIEKIKNLLNSLSLENI